MDINYVLQGEIYKGNDLIIINNVTAVFEGYFNIFDYNNLKKEVTKELNKQNKQYRVFEKFINIYIYSLIYKFIVLLKKIKM